MILAKNSMFTRGEGRGGTYIYYIEIISLATFSPKILSLIDRAAELLRKYNFLIAL